ncbi:hypothetical protein ACWZJV_19550 [Nocardioides sp. WG-D5]
MTSEDLPREPPADETDPRLAALRERLNDTFLDVSHGEYFRSRVHGWAAYRSNANLSLPEGVAERLPATLTFGRTSDAEDISSLDAFVIAYHAAETYWRYLFALLDGDGPTGMPAVEMMEVRAGDPLFDRITEYISLDDAYLTPRLDFLFLPPELAAKWSDDRPSIDGIQEYLRQWCRELGRFLNDFRRANNSVKHGLAVVSRPGQLAFVPADAAFGPPVDLINGPTLSTIETDLVLDEDGKPRKGANGKNLRNWFWVDRAIDPEELIAQAIVTADLLDWLRAIAQIRLLRPEGLQARGIQVGFMVRSEPTPTSIRKSRLPGRTFRLPFNAEPLPPEAAAEVLRRLDLGDDNEDA